MSNSLIDSGRARFFRRCDLLACLALLLVSILWAAVIPLPYLPLDDAAYIFDNPYVRTGLTWEGVRWAFTTTYGGFWFPLLWLSLALDTNLYGLHAWGYHLTNVLFHAANTLLIYLLFRQMLTCAGRPGEWKKCLFAAALFAVHPQRVESIAWAVERKDVLASFLGLLAIFAYFRYVRQPSYGRYFLVALLLLLSLMAKPMLVTIPPLLLVLDYWPLGRLGRGRFWPLVKEKVPLLMFGLVVSCNTYLIQLCAGSLPGSVGERARNTVINYFLYVRDFFYVGHLSIIYGPMPWVRAWHVAAAVGFVIGVTVLAALLVRRGNAAGKPLLVGWLWYGGVVFPMSGFVQSGYNIRADRFSYFPMIGIVLALVWGVIPLLRLDRLRGVSVAAAVAAVGMYGWLSLERISLWHDPLVLAEHDLRWEPENVLLEEVAGLAAENHIQYDDVVPYLHDPEGLAAKNRAFRERAMAHFRRAEQLEPAMRPLSYIQETTIEGLMEKVEAKRAEAAGEVASQPATYVSTMPTTASAATRAATRR